MIFVSFRLNKGKGFYFFRFKSVLCNRNRENPAPNDLL